MKSYKIHLTKTKSFTFITFEAIEGVPDAIFEKFGIWPVKVEQL